MLIWYLIACACLVLAGIGWALCAHAGDLDDAEGRGDEHPDDPAYCPPCGGPCFDEGAEDDRRLP